MKVISFDEWYSLLQRISDLENNVKSALVFGIISFIGAVCLTIIVLIDAFNNKK